MDKQIQIDCSCLLCPVCGEDERYQHISRVGTELDPDCDETQIYRGTSKVFEVQSGKRRSSLRIDLSGECGHDWSLILNQHKALLVFGLVLLTIQRFPLADESMTIDEHLFQSIRRINYKMEQTERAKRLEENILAPLMP
jgi:hypothetical protein